MCGPARLRWQFQLMHQLLDSEFESTTDQRAAALYARVTVCEDVIVNGVLGGGKPLAFSEWRGRTGLSELPPLPSGAQRREWASRVHIESPRFRAYACAVHAATDAYLSRLDAPAYGETHVQVLVALLLSVSTTRT